MADSVEEKRTNGERIQPFVMTAEHWTAGDQVCNAVGHAFTLCTLNPTETNVYLMCLLASIIDGLPAVIVTAKSQGSAHAPSIAMSLLDAYEDFKLLLKADRHVLDLRLRDAIGELKTWEHMAEAAREYPEMKERLRVFEGRRIETEKRCAALRLRGATVPQMRQRMRDANIEEAIWIAFHGLSPTADSHLSLLRIRHPDENGGVKFWDGIGDHQKASTIQAAGMLAVSSLLDLIPRVESNREGYVKAAMRAANVHQAFGRMIPNPPGTEVDEPAQ